MLKQYWIHISYTRVLVFRRWQMKTSQNLQLTRSLTPRKLDNTIDRGGIDTTTSSQAPSYASESETMNLSLTDSLTGVKCRATSVAKNDSSYKLNTLGPFCLWQCFSTFLNFSQRMLGSSLMMDWLPLSSGWKLTQLKRSKFSAMGHPAMDLARIESDGGLPLFTTPDCSLNSGWKLTTRMYLAQIRFDDGLLLTSAGL